MYRLLFCLHQKRLTQLSLNNQQLILATVYIHIHRTEPSSYHSHREFNFTDTVTATHQFLTELFTTPMKPLHKFGEHAYTIHSYTHHNSRKKQETTSIINEQQLNSTHIQTNYQINRSYEHTHAHTEPFIAIGNVNSTLFNVENERI